MASSLHTFLLQSAGIQLTEKGRFEFIGMEVLSPYTEQFKIDKRGKEDKNSPIGARRVKFGSEEVVS